MKCGVLILLYVSAFLLQMTGAIGVIQEVMTSIRNMRQFKVELTEAEAAADEHRRIIQEARDRPSRFRQQAMDRLAAAGEHFVDQTGRRRRLSGGHW